MDREFFKQLAALSNRYARAQMIAKNGTLYCGIKWENISAFEMIYIFGILLQMNTEPHKMGSYNLYFNNSPHLILGKKYSIRCTINSEGILVSNNGNRCHQLRHFICTFNRKARKLFHLGPNASFDEGGVSMCSRFCPVRQYNKDKPDKFRVEFFILADAERYFI
eukprot:4322295-Ditylum_brightwellii.AAC.2